ncbi:MAG TPA: hypothetical protein VLU73_10135, partial [Methylococcaceae bacterium]|nr:hypothetical protein [Methylococcaceae bacterium]
VRAKDRRITGEWPLQGESKAATTATIYRPWPAGPTNHDQLGEIGKSMILPGAQGFEQQGFLGR